MGREIVALYQGVAVTRFIIEAQSRRTYDWEQVDRAYFDVEKAKKAAGEHADTLETAVRVVKITP